MRKAIILDHEFDKERFAELLRTAQGDRQQKVFAEDIGMSKSYLNCYLGCKIARPLTPSTLHKIAFASENRVSIEDLLRASGYDPSKYISEKSAPTDIQPKIDQGQTFEMLANATITNAFLQTEYSWLINGNDKHSSFCDLDIELKNSEFTHWYFNFLLSKSGNIPKLPNSQDKRIFEYYSRLLFKPPVPYTMYSFVTNSQEVFDSIKDNPPAALSLFMSVMLIDISTLTIVDEEIIRTALTPDSKTKIPRLCNGI